MGIPKVLKITSFQKRCPPRGLSTALCVISGTNFVVNIDLVYPVDAHLGIGHVSKKPGIPENECFRELTFFLMGIPIGLKIINFQMTGVPRSLSTALCVISGTNFVVNIDLVYPVDVHLGIGHVIKKEGIPENELFQGLNFSLV